MDNNDIGIKELVKFHLTLLKENKFEHDNIENTIIKIEENFKEIMLRELANELGLKCLYSCYTHNCNLCLECIEIYNEFENIEELIDSQISYEERRSDYESYQINVLGRKSIY